MASPLEGYGNLLNLSEMKGFSPDNFSSIDIKNINSFDAFIDESENPELLKGTISKIQMGEGIEQVDLENLNAKEVELVNDLKALNGESGPQEVADTFSDLMGKYLDNVDQKNKAAAKAVQTFASGGNIDLHSVMIASEKASLSMQLTMALRSKILSAYQEIQNVRV